MCPTHGTESVLKANRGTKRDGTLVQITSEILSLNLMTNQVQRCEEEGQTVGYEGGGGESCRTCSRSGLVENHTLVPWTEGANLTSSNGMLPRLGSNY